MEVCNFKLNITIANSLIAVNRIVLVFSRKHIDIEELIMSSGFGIKNLKIVANMTKEQSNHLIKLIEKQIDVLEIKTEAKLLCTAY